MDSQSFEWSCAVYSVRIFDLWERCIPQQRSRYKFRKNELDDLATAKWDRNFAEKEIEETSWALVYIYFRNNQSILCPPWDSCWQKGELRTRGQVLLPQVFLGDHRCALRCNLLETPSSRYCYPLAPALCRSQLSQTWRLLFSKDFLTGTLCVEVWMKMPIEVPATLTTEWWNISCFLSL